MNEDSLHNSLLDVRKAQRLIHNYNLRVLDMAREIDRSLDRMKFSSTHLECDMREMASWKPDGEIPGLGDSVPLQTLAFSWSTQSAGEPAGPKDRVLFACFCADPEYWVNEDENIDTWSTPEQSKSVVTLLLVQPTKELKSLSTTKMWASLDYGEAEFLVATKARGFRYVMNEFDLSRIPTKSTLTDDVRSFISAAQDLLR
jgi:hypothetical protein